MVGEQLIIKAEHGFFRLFPDLANIPAAGDDHG